ncbi:hypothetical protein BC940DRAFT_268322 [Gongronella butleri]|nr:hypothetical protein BC940DRAFT_268322 [Gongronella butleri]
MLKVEERKGKKIKIKCTFMMVGPFFSFVVNEGIRWGMIIQLVVVDGKNMDPFTRSNDTFLDHGRAD